MISFEIFIVLKFTTTFWNYFKLKLKFILLCIKKGIFDMYCMFSNLFKFNMSELE